MESYSIKEFQITWDVKFYEVEKKKKKENPSI